MPINSSTIIQVVLQPAVCAISRCPAPCLLRRVLSCTHHHEHHKSNQDVHPLSIGEGRGGEGRGGEGRGEGGRGRGGGRGEGRGRRGEMRGGRGEGRGRGGGGIGRPSQ